MGESNVLDPIPESKQIILFEIKIFFSLSRKEKIHNFLIPGFILDVLLDLVN